MQYLSQCEQRLSLNFVSIFAPRCFNPDINFYDELVVQTIGPILVGILILAIFVLSSIINSLNRDKAKSDFLSRIFLSSFIFFPSASTAVFETFNCDDDFESGSSYLKADYRLECVGSDYDGYLGYTLLMILIYPIGIPLFYFVCLLSIRSLILGVESNGASTETVVQMKRDSSRLSVVKFDNVSNSSLLNAFSKVLDGRLAIERACLNPVTYPYSFLFVAYKPEFWYWACVECERRLSLTGLLVFMYPGSKKQVLLAMLICFIWTMSYSNIQPYLGSSHSFFMMSSQWGVLLQLYAVFLIINHSFDSSSELIGGLAVGVIMFTYCLVSLARVSRSKILFHSRRSKSFDIKEQILRNLIDCLK